MANIIQKSKRKVKKSIIFYKNSSFQRLFVLKKHLLAILSMRIST